VQNYANLRGSVCCAAIECVGPARRIIGDHSVYQLSRLNNSGLRPLLDFVSQLSVFFCALVRDY
jgi:hypothetical protein